MTLDPDILVQSYSYFQMEAPQLLGILEHELLNLQAEENNIHRVHNLLRATHTLKGIAATLELHTIRKVTHSLEDIFRALCRPDIVLNAQVKALLFEGYECLRSPLMAQLNGSPVNDAEVLERTASIFAILQQQLGDCFDQNTPLPSSEDLGFDMTQILFDTTVRQILHELSELLLSQPPDLIDQLQAQAESLLAIGESVYLSGFKAIAQVTLAALTIDPDQALEIGQQAVIDFQAGWSTVMSGDRTQGGTPSLALQQFFGTSHIQPEDLLLETVWGDNDTNYLPPSPAPRISPSPPPPLPLQPTMVRVNVDHLEQLNYLNAELLTNQNRQSLQNEKIRLLMRKLFGRVRQFQQLLSNLQESAPLIHQKPAAINSSDRSFDFPILLQSLLEEAMQLEVDTDVLDQINRQVTQVQDKQSKLLTTSRDVLLSARMQHVGEVLNRFYPVLQQLQTLHDKPVNLTLTGTEVLVDKAVAERLYDPLLHLVRNAFDHGIEPMTVRVAQGKPKIGQIEISASYRGSQLIIEVRDDGQGLNFETIRQKAVERQILSMETARLKSEAQLIELLFEPGFSTTDQLSELSGRGIGLDVVRAQVQAIQGAVSIQTEELHGTTFSLQIPLSLTMDQLLICQASSQVYALSVEGIEQILLPKPEQIQNSEHGKILHKDGELIPIYHLGEILDYAIIPVNSPKPIAKTKPLLLIPCEDRLLALEVDQIIGEQELVIRPFGKMISIPDYVYGGSILADGRPTLAIASTTLLQKVLATTKILPQEPRHSYPLLPTAKKNTEEKQYLAASTLNCKQILIVDDSITIRQTLALTLQKAGYQVLQAASGHEAIRTSRQKTPIDLIICDLDMPQMNGLEFLSTKRQEPTLSQIPVIILTSRTAEKHRYLTRQLGAIAYLTKPYHQEELLTIIADTLNYAFPA